MTKDDFIIKAKNVHGDKYNYSKVEYINNKTKVCIICPEHGEFWQTPTAHFRGQGCPACSRSKQSGKNSFIEKARNVHGDKYDYSKVEYINSKTKVCIICPEHGEFWQTPHDHLSKKGCVLCYRKRSSMLRTRTLEQFIEKAKEIHGDKYDYSKVEYKKNGIKVCIICPEHGEFWQTPHNHLKGQGCVRCSGKHVFSTQDFLNEAKKVHGDKYDYSKAKYENTKTKVCINCPEHGEFWQAPNEHLQGRGCPKCARIESPENLEKKKEDFIKRAIEVHNNRYSYERARYKNMLTHLLITCPIHGDFFQQPSVHICGHGCPKCAQRHNYTTEEYINEAKSKQKKQYDYSKVEYKRAGEKVCIICPIHGEFWQLAYDHLQGRGCPKCAKHVSKSETEISDYIKSFGLNVIERERGILKKYEIDIWVPDKKVAIEYNGMIWHSLKYRKDKNYHLRKTEECEKQGIKIVQIFEFEYMKHKKIVLSKIRQILGLNKNLPKVYGRTCKVEEIDKKAAKKFLEKYHIQGNGKSNVNIGAFYAGDLVAVMSLKQERKNSDQWELTRFATDDQYVYAGVGSKIFSYFVRSYKPKTVKSFADRRWSTNMHPNFYEKLGFGLEKILRPDYHYTNRKLEFIHKFNCRKDRLVKKYGLDSRLTEREMTEKLRLYPIYDCGLFKYVWRAGT